MRHKPHYGEAGFCERYYNLARLPETAAECREQLETLTELYRHSKSYSWLNYPDSKRYNRIQRMFWAFKKAGSR